MHQPASLAPACDNCASNYPPYRAHFRRTQPHRVHP